MEKIAMVELRCVHKELAMILMACLATVSLVLSQNPMTDELTPLEGVIEIDEVKPQCERDRIQGETASLPEVPDLSPDRVVDQEIVSLLQREELTEGELEEIAPQVEDLSHLIQHPAVGIVEGSSIEGASAYESLPVTATDKQKISTILTTMAENNLFKLLFERKRLEKIGREINHVHPVRFLGVVFNDSYLIYCMFEIRRSGFKWEGFIGGFSKRFLEEVKDGNVDAYIPGLAASLNLKPKELMPYVFYSDFEGLVTYLMEKSPQK